METTLRRNWLMNMTNCNPSTLHMHLEVKSDSSIHAIAHLKSIKMKKKGEKKHKALMIRQIK